MNDLPRISVIIPTFQRSEMLHETLASILGDSYAGFWEVLVIDQNVASHGNSEKRVRWFSAPDVDFISLPKARNFGADHADAPDILVFLDDDVLISPGFLTAHADAYAQAEVGAVAGRVVRSGQEKKHNNQAVGRVSWFGAFSANYLGDTSCFCIDFMGCNFSLRTTAFQMAGRFDEGFLAEGSFIREDSDMAARIQEMGFHIYFSPRAEIIHRVAAVGGCRASTERITWYRAWFYNNFRYYAKHYPLWRIPFFTFHYLRPLLACSFYYGRGTWEAIRAPWQGIVAAINDVAADRKY
jgi:GT2 family glycosyltransferase